MKAITTIGLAAILGLGLFVGGNALAQGPGYWGHMGGGYGHMDGYNRGRHMDGPAYGPHMRGNWGPNQGRLDRRDFHRPGWMHDGRGGWDAMPCNDETGGRNFRQGRSWRR